MFNNLKSVVFCLILGYCFIVSGCKQEDNSTGGVHLYSVNVKVLEVQNAYFTGEIVEEKWDFDKGDKIKILYNSNTTINKREAWITSGRVELSDVKENDYITIQYFPEKLEEDNTIQIESILYIGEEENYQKLNEQK